jgi:hypothetical protein
VHHFFDVVQSGGQFSLQVSIREVRSIRVVSSEADKRGVSSLQVRTKKEVVNNASL